MRSRGQWKSWYLFCAGLVFLLVVLLSGCHKKVKAEFQRPPASSVVPAPVPLPAQEPEEVPESPDAEPESTEETSSLEPVPKRPRTRTQAPAPAPVQDPVPPPALPRLSSGAKNSETSSIRDKLGRIEALISTIRSRVLKPGQREQVASARAFLSHARKAYAEGDYRRAAVLADKGLILAVDVEQSSR